MPQNPASTVQDLPDAIVVACEYTVRDIVEFRTFCEYNRPKARASRNRARKMAWCGLAIALPLFTLAVVGCSNLTWFGRVLTANGVTGTGVKLAVFGLGLVSILTALFSGLWVLLATMVFTTGGEKAYRKRQIEAARGYLSEKAGRLPVQLRIDSFGVYSEASGEVVFVPWDRYAAIHDSPTQIVSVSTENEAGFVPKRFFGEGAERDERIRRINEWAKAGGGGADTHIYPRLSDKDIECRACGYNLRGTRSPVCSECGAPIEVD